MISNEELPHAYPSNDLVPSIEKITRVQWKMSRPRRVLLFLNDLLIAASLLHAFEHLQKGIR